MSTGGLGGAGGVSHGNHSPERVQSDDPETKEGSTGARKVEVADTGKKLPDKGGLAKRKGRGLRLGGSPSSSPGNSPEVQGRTVQVPPSESAELKKIPDTSHKLWEQLESRKPTQVKCTEGEKTAYKFKQTEIVAPTAVRLSRDENKLTPYNQITLGGQKVGIAARGPTAGNNQERATFMTAAVENGCKAIVNIATSLEGVSDYIPRNNQAAQYNSVTVTTIDEPFFYGPKVRSEIEVKLWEEDKGTSLKYFLKGDIGNRKAGDPKELVDLARELPEGPVIVHCKMGIGRTAMFMLVRALVNDTTLTKENLVQTVFNMVQDGRQCRGEFLENEAQLDSVLKAGAILLGMPEEELYQKVDQYLASST
ncbi:hypothetical protein EOPP23_01015 [Endozoicomonas sp. OPT23]|uniref:protein-tyrosine phosphatase family protein n=1 Tax=Endozoicomonas sp. OPT23 TaxID=2072845 RepID=UPI00129B3029|nr:protein-tyrosine phosphatase family protein [Endozoicomonas sp. OPT23]MRI31572.1 hypothetical protein [Endozoicomonas sp. OPT23]